VLVALGVLLVYMFANPATRIDGLFVAPVFAYLLSRLLVNSLFDDAPQWVRSFLYLGWHGHYRSFEDRKVRVLEGERDRPTRVFAADIFDILALRPDSIELARLAARYGDQFVRGGEEPARDEWLFTDAACLAFVRGYMDEARTPRGRDAKKLALWLERSVFMPIDNRRSAATGKTYAFTRESARR